MIPDPLFPFHVLNQVYTPPPGDENQRKINKKSKLNFECLFGMILITFHQNLFEIVSKSYLKSYPKRHQNLTSFCIDFAWFSELVA